MTEIKRFEYEPLDISIRATLHGGEPWFVAVDACRALGIGNSRQALTRLDQDERDTVILNDATPGNPRRQIVSESGLYALILHSRKPEARAFRKWITSEVLPQLRTKGYYFSESATEEQLRDAKSEAQSRLIRLQERKDYRNILNLIKKGGAQDGRDYADVQNHIYMRCFGMTARTLRARQPQIDKPGWEAGKNHLTDAQLKLLGNVVLGVQADLGIRHPEGDAKLWEIHAAIDRVTQR